MARPSIGLGTGPERSRRARRGTQDQRGVSYIEVMIFSLILTIAVVGLTTALRVTTGATLVAKERSRALALAQDKLEEVKNMGYEALRPKVSNYPWPTVADANAPLAQAPGLPPYPSPPFVAPLPSEDPWTPESILSGGITYWRHVKIKCVEDIGGTLFQRRIPDPPYEVGGTDTSSNLMQIEVNVTWSSRLTKEMRQVRLVTLLANLAPPVVRLGRITGTVYDEGPTLAAGDDTVVGQPLVVYATNGLGDSFTTSINPGKGSYELNDLPDGTYTVRLAGGGGYYDGGYNGTADPCAAPCVCTSLYIGPGQFEPPSAVSIWTRKVARVKAYGTFTGASAGDVVRISAGPSTTDFVVGATGCPCFFELNDIRWPAAGSRTMNVTLTRGSLSFGMGTICMDSTQAASATDYIWGVAPPPGYVATPCGACPAPCQSPSEATPLDAAQWASGTASVKVHVVEYKGWSLADANLAEAKISLNDGTSATATTDATGLAPGGYVTNVQPLPGNSIRINVWYTTTDYSTETYVIQQPLSPGGSFDVATEKLPPDFRLKPICMVTGTIWKACDSPTGLPPCNPATSVGFGAIPVNIFNDSTGFTAVATTDAAGRFVQTGVVREDSTYKYDVKPSSGADYVCRPVKLLGVFSEKGKSYWEGQDESSVAKPFEFVLQAVNGRISGTVFQGGREYPKGAIVYATTYTGAFPASLPDASLSGEYTFSTITGTDGSFLIKVASGFSYNLHVFSPDNPVAPVTVTTGVVAADSTVWAGLVILP